MCSGVVWFLILKLTFCSEDFGGGGARWNKWKEFIAQKKQKENNMGHPHLHHARHQVLVFLYFNYGTLGGVLRTFGFIKPPIS
jgi:hypothetical protein